GDILTNTTSSSTQGSGVLMAVEEVDGFAAVELVLGAGAIAVDDLGGGRGDFFGEFGGLLPVHVAVDQVVELVGDRLVADGISECVGDVLDGSDFAALRDVDRAAAPGGENDVVPLRALEFWVDAVDRGGTPTATVHAVGEVIGLEVRLDGGFVGAVDGAGPGGMRFVDASAGQDLVMHGDGADENELARAGLTRGFEQAQRRQDVALEVGEGRTAQGVPVGGVVDDHLGAGDEAGDRLRAGDVAFDEFADEAFDVIAAAGRADQGADLVAGAMQSGDGRAADETA